ncbi:dockerin type I repeat-containing protein [Sodaliphilus pleomorphus]|nr:dockerin type I repeat-containing protein [Sodaliphilus pleomorphus]
MENRQLEGWDAYCPGHGMLINHVDSTNVSVWTSNQVNCNPEHNYYKFMPAGGASQSSASDPFPGTGAVTMITNATEPNLLSWAQEHCPYIITNIAEKDGNITLKIANDTVIGDVEDFEDMAATTATSLADVQGKYATWSFTKCNVTAPGSGKASGEHSVAMKLPSAITSGDTYYDAYQVSFKVFNPLSMTVKYTLSTSTDGGATWTNAASATGETTQAVSGNGTHVLYWVVNTKQDTPTRYRVILSTGSKTSAVYLDDFTLYYRSATGDINGDGVVNVTDVTALINVILGSASYDASLCDINGDGTINVTDVTALLNLILAAE